MEDLDTPTWGNLNDNSDQHHYQNMNDSDNSIDTGSISFFPDNSADWQSFDPINAPNSYTSTPANKYTSTPKATSLSLPTPSPDRKYSVPVNLCSAQDGNHSNNSNVKMRDKTNSVPSRPSSLIEAGGPELKELKVFEIGNLGDHGGRDRENPRNINAISHAMNEVSASQRHGMGTGVSHFGQSLSVHGGLGSTHSHGQGTVAGDRVNLMPSNSTSTSRGSSQAYLLECGASASTSETPKSPVPGKC